MKKLPSLLLLVLFTACASQERESPKNLGRFNVEKDLLLVQFDCKTDVDDLHSVAALGTLLHDNRFSRVSYHAVAGTYGTQKGLYVPANELFQATFSNHWSDAHTNFNQALAEVTGLVLKVLKAGGDIWISEAGQSDFSAALVGGIQLNLPDLATKERIHIVQHSDWNEKVTGEENLAFVKANTNYHKIPDGNAVGNGTPGYRSEEIVNWQDKITHPGLIENWNMAIKLGNQFNGVDDRYNNEAITKGGLDFSDHSEVSWIFGFEGLKDHDAFFDEFGK
ncbi:MAG: hypothetical protein HEP71_27680 [Roseivirga sp.]|nr:hypothetical protein [Roseivirga sp.]